MSTPRLILSLAHAEAVCSAMRVLNDAGGHLYAASFDAFAVGEVLIDVRAFDDDRIEVRSSDGLIVETHAGLPALAAAYGLPQ